MLSVHTGSALLQLPDTMEEKVTVDADHSDIAKFSDRRAHPYVTALRYLKKFEAESVAEVSRRFKNSFAQNS